MIKHVFKLIWNQKKKNSFIILELFLVFLVIAVIATNIVDYLMIYNEPLGWNVENVVSLKLEPKKVSKDEGFENLNLLKEKLGSISNVEDVSYSYFATPYNWGMYSSSIDFDKKSTHATIRTVDVSFRSLLKVNLIEGEWFTDENTKGNYPSVVIDRLAREKLFEDNKAIGKIIELNSTDYKIIGVVEPFKRNKFEKSTPTMFKYLSKDMFNNDGLNNNTVDFILKFKNSDDIPYKKIKNEAFQVIDPKKWSIYSISSIENNIRNDDRSSNKEHITKVMIAVFVLFNVLLGLTGIFGYTIKQRKQEIGLRRAIGSSSVNVKKQLVWEMLMISLFAIIPGLFIVIQLPFYGFNTVNVSVYLVTVSLVALFILLMVVVFVYIPTHIASKTEPALALKDE